MKKKLVCRFISVLIIVSMFAINIFSTVTLAESGIKYIVAGTEELTGYNWEIDPDVATENVMTKMGEVYTITFKSIKPVDGLQFKIVETSSFDFIGDQNDDNIIFNVITECDVKITFNPITEEIIVTGDGVELITELEVSSAYVVGEGCGKWLNGIYWETDAVENCMIEVSEDVYQKTYNNIDKGDNYQFKLVVNGSWACNWGGSFLGSGVETEAEYNGKNIVINVPVDSSDVRITLDLREFDYVTKKGAKFTVQIGDVIGSDVFVEKDNIITPVVEEENIQVKKEETNKIEVEMQSDFKFTIPEDVPILGGGEMKVDLSCIPICAKVEGNNLCVGIGIKDITEVDENTWCSFKNYVKGYKDNIKKGKSLLDTSVFGEASAGMGSEFDVGFYGYYEATISDGAIIDGSGMAQLNIEASVSSEWQTTLVPIPVPIVLKAKGEISAEDKLKITIDLSSSKLNFSNELTLTLPKINVSAGVGIAHVADVSVYGEAKNEIKITSSPKRIKGTLFGELGVSAKVLMFSGKLPILKEKDGWTYYDSNNKNLPCSVGSDFTHFLSYEIDRSYVKSQSDWLQNSRYLKGNSIEAVGSVSEGFDYTTLQSSVYNDASPKIINTKNQTIMVWVGDDETRTTGNHTVVEYSIYDKNSKSWSDSVIVDDNGTADFYPEIATDGVNTYLVWVDCNKTFDESVEMEEMASSCEIKIAKFNTDTNHFENIKQLTNNSTVDIKPSVAVNNKKAVVIWRHNSANSLIEAKGVNTVVCAEELENGEYSISTLLTTENVLYEIATDGVNYAYTVGSGDAVNDIEVYGAKLGSEPTKLSDNTTNEYNIMFNNISGESLLTYQCDGVVYCSPDMSNVRALSDKSFGIFGDYQFLSDGTYTKLYSIENVDYSTEIFSYSINSNGLWANPVQISTMDKYVRNPSAVIDDNGDLQFVFLLTEAEITEESVNESTNLCTQIVQDSHNIMITDISYDSENVLSNVQLPVAIHISNNGTLDESDIHVEVNDSNGNVVFIDTLDSVIKSGESEEVVIQLPLGEITGTAEYGITVMSKDNTSTSTNTFTIGTTELQLMTSIARKGSETGVLATVQNNSCVVTEVAFVIKADNSEGETLETFALGEVKGNESLSYFLDNENIIKYKQQTNNIYMEIISYKYEESLANNSERVYIADVLAKSDYEIGDVNNDGIVNITDCTLIQKYLVEIETECFDFALADINYNGKVSIKDATCIQKQLAGVR